MNIIHHNKSVTVDEMAVVILDFLDIKSGTVVPVQFRAAQLSGLGAVIHRPNNRPHISKISGIKLISC